MSSAAGGVVCSTKAKSTLFERAKDTGRDTSTGDAHHFDKCRIADQVVDHLAYVPDHGFVSPGCPECDKIRDELLETALMYTLPGEGFAGPRCGEAFEKKCGTCGKTWEGLSTCNQRDCPYCGPHPHDYGRWATIRGKAIRGRILDGMAFYDTRAHHVILSPPQDTKIRSKADHKRLLADARKVLRDYGHVSGEALIVHPYRSKHVDGTCCERFRCQEKHVWVPGLHLHCFCLGDWVARGDYVKWKTNWILIRKDTFQPRVLDYYAYALSHCGILQDDADDDHPLTHTVVWSGSLSYNKMPRGELEHAAGIRDPDFCPWCGSLDVRTVPKAAEKRDERYLSKLGDRPPPPAICPDCGCGDCRLIRQAGPCDHVFKPDPYSPRITRVGDCTGTIDPLMGESMMIIRCMSGYADYLEPM